MAKPAKATTLSISLPVEMAQAVYRQVREGHYTSASDLVREAVRRLLATDAAAPSSEDDD